MITAPCMFKSWPKNAVTGISGTTELASPLMLVRGQTHIARFCAAAPTSPRTRNSEHNESLFVSRGSAGRFRGIWDGVRALWLRQRTSARGLPRGRVWPSSRGTCRSFVLAWLRALHLDLRRRRRHGGSDRGMASPAPGTGSVPPGRAGCWVAGCGRGVVTGPGSGLPEEPVSGVQSGRAGDRVAPRVPSRAPGTRRSTPGAACRQAKMALLTCRFSARRASFGVLPPASFLS